MNAAVARRQVFRFDKFEVDTLAHELRRHGQPIRLQEQPYQLLLVLLEHAGEVVTREQLRGRLWPASILVDFDHGLNNSIARLREVFGDTAATPRFIATVPRVGYRFIAEVVRVSAEDGHPGIAAVTPAATPVPADTPRRTPRWQLLAGVVIATLALAAILRVAMRDPPPDPQTNGGETALLASVAVLPFESLSPKPGDADLAAGLTEAIVGKLVAIPGLPVVARTSSYQFRDSPRPATELGQVLRASHLLQGSVGRSEGRLQLTSRLLDTRSGETVWIRRFEHAEGDLAAFQEDIAFAVAAALKISLLDADEFRIRRRGTDDVDAYRLYLIALPHLLGRARPSDPAVARRSLEAALARDPEFAAAHAGLARYHFRRAWSDLSDVENGAQLGLEAAERAVALEPSLPEALQARANFRFWQHRFQGDYAAYVSAQSDLRRAIGLDPTNSLAFEDFGRALLWHEPSEAMTLLQRAIDTDPLCLAPNIMIASLLGLHGDMPAARARCAELSAREPGPTACVMAIATLETYYGNFQRAVPLLRQSEKVVRGAARLQLWSIHQSMGDRTGALQWLDFGSLRFEKPLSDAARLAMDGRYEAAYGVLERGRRDFPFSRVLDLPAAKFALIAGRPREAREILEQRLPDLASGIEPITARNVLPALDLATALAMTGARDEANALLERVTTHLDGPEALRLPLFAFQRARAHALAGEAGPAIAALERAYAAGLRTTWALDLRPQSFLYIDPIEADPAFGTLRDDPKFKAWLRRIAADNALQLERVRTAARAASLP